MKIIKIIVVLISFIILLGATSPPASTEQDVICKEFDVELQRNDEAFNQSHSPEHLTAKHSLEYCKMENDDLIMALFKTNFYDETSKNIEQAVGVVSFDNFSGEWQENKWHKIYDITLGKPNVQDSKKNGQAL